MALTRVIHKVDMWQRPYPWHVDVKLPCQPLQYSMWLDLWVLGRKQVLDCSDDITERHLQTHVRCGTMLQIR